MNKIKFIFNKYKKIFILFSLLIMTTLLKGCCKENLVLMHPAGDIGTTERALILTAFGLMLIIVVPVIIMTLIFSIRYRASNVKNSKYHPNWSDSKKIEFAIWAIPIIIIIILSILTWKSTHQLDPKKPISPSISPIIINVVALDWKWLFIYPHQNIAVINELVFPINIPIQFNITSNSVMNSFFIPQLGSQIYAMAGMSSQLHLIAKIPGKYQGISANFSGKGFSGMKFTVFALKNKTEFDQWIYKVKTSTYYIENISNYEEIAKPSQFNPIMYFSYIPPNLFYEIINKFNNTNHKHYSKTKI